MKFKAPTDWLHALYKTYVSYVFVQRFQKTYEALEEEGDAEKKQLVAIHQQRVQAKLNIKKRHSMEHYMAVLTEAKPDVSTD